MANNKNQHDELENVQEALSKSEAFIENNRKSLLIGVSVVVLVVLAFIGVRNFYIAPKNAEAADKLAACVEYFERDSFALALNGDGANDGLVSIIDNYSMTKTSNLASLYAGVCAYKLGNYEDAVEYLDGFSADAVNATPVAIGLAGDCYSAMEDYNKAASYYKDAASYDNNFTAPTYLKKLGIVYEELGKNAEALKAYETIKNDYFASAAAIDIDKYIARVKAAK